MWIWAKDNLSKPFPRPNNPPPNIPGHFRSHFAPGHMTLLWFHFHNSFTDLAIIINTAAQTVRECIAALTAYGRSSSALCMSSAAQGFRIVHTHEWQLTIQWIAYTNVVVQNMSTAVVLLLLAVLVNCLADPTPAIFFPFGTDVGDSVVPVGDTTSSPPINIATARFKLFDVGRNTAYVSRSPRYFVRILTRIACLQNSLADTFAVV